MELKTDPQWCEWEQQFLEKEKQLSGPETQPKSKHNKKLWIIGAAGVLVTAPATFLILTIENKLGFVKIGTPVWLINILIFLTTSELLIILIWSTLSSPLKNNSKSFSVRGIYAFIRHPFYTTLIFHFPIITALNYRSFVLLFFIPLYYSFWSRLVQKEEEYLVGIFEEDYVDYMAKIPRFIPWR